MYWMTFGVGFIFLVQAFILDLLVRPRQNRLFWHVLSQPLSSETLRQLFRLRLWLWGLTAVALLSLFIWPAVAVIAQLLAIFGVALQILRRYPRDAAPEAPPTYTDAPGRSVWTYLSAPIHGLNLGLWLLNLSVLLLILPRLPDQIPVQFDAAGAVNRYGSPAELWLLPMISGFLTAVFTVCAVGMARARRRAPKGQSEAYLALEDQRRRLLVGLLETVMLAETLSMTAIGIALAVGSLPGWGALTPVGILVGILISGCGLLIAIAGRLTALMTLAEEQQKLAQDNFGGTDPAAWRWHGMIYYAPDDPDWWVPKRGGMGQTLNFARSQSWWFLGSVLAAPFLLMAGIWLATR